MAYGRKRSYRKRSSTYKKKKRVAYRTKRYSRRVPRLVQTRCLVVRLEYPEAIYTTSTVINNGVGFALQPNLCQNWGNYLNMYDAFKIKKCSISLKPPFDNINLQANSNAVIPSGAGSTEIWSAIDWDSPSLVPASLLEVQGYQNAKVTKGAMTHYRSFVPKIFSTIRRSSLANCVQAIPQRGWLDMATSDIILSPSVIFSLPITNIAIAMRVDVSVWVCFSQNRTS